MTVERRRADTYARIALPFLVRRRPYLAIRPPDQVYISTSRMARFLGQSAPAQVILHGRQDLIRYWHPTQLLLGNLDRASSLKVAATAHLPEPIGSAASQLQWIGWKT